MTPQIRIALACIVLISAFIAGWTFRGYRDGNDYRDLVNKITTEKLDAIQTAEAKSQQMQEQISLLDTQHTKEMQHAKARINDLLTRINDRSTRLYVPAICPGGGVLPAVPGNPGVDHGSTYAELDPATGTALIKLTEEGDQCIRQLSFLQQYLVTTGLAYKRSL